MASDAQICDVPEQSWHLSRIIFVEKKLSCGETLGNFWKFWRNFGIFGEILPQFTRFHVEKKLSPKVHLWSKNDKYEVWDVPNYTATLPPFSILKMVLCICVPKYLKKWNIFKMVLCTCSQIFKKLKYFENGVPEYSQIFKKLKYFENGVMHICSQIFRSTPLVSNRKPKLDDLTPFNLQPLPY